MNRNGAGRWDWGRIGQYILGEYSRYDFDNIFDETRE
jgi:hypothetical protein